MPISCLDLFQHVWLGMRLWEEFPVGIISSWMVDKQSIESIQDIGSGEEVSAGMVSAFMCKRNIL